MDIQHKKFTDKDSNSLFFTWFNVENDEHLKSKTIVDIKISQNHIIVSINDGCLYWCDVVNCTSLTKVDSSVCVGENLYGTISISRSGDRLLHIKNFREGVTSKQGTTAVATYIIDFDILHLVDFQQVSSWKRCGTISIYDVVFVYSHAYDNDQNYNPCKLGICGNLLSCLILGEPYIFDIHDCNSAHPISSFGISSNRMGYVINRFDFLNNGLFFYEIIPSYDVQQSGGPRGFIFDVKQELQPTLIASQVVFPTLATAITPAESFILVNHYNEAIYYFTHSGRIFYSKTKDNTFEIQLNYRHDLSFYIFDVLRMSNNTYSLSTPHSHNFEHPFAFFSPGLTKLVYFSFYQSLSGTFVASAVSIASINDTISLPKSIIHIGGEHSLIQCGVNLNEDLLILVYESMAENYFDVKVTLLESMPNYSLGTNFILAQNEIYGVWLTQRFLTKEMTRAWIIPFLQNNNFYLASHNVKKDSTIITRYSLNQDLTLRNESTFSLPNCFAITNINDYKNFISIVLCAEQNFKKESPKKYSLIVANFSSSWDIVCRHSIDHVFKPLKTAIEDLPNVNIPLFDYDPVSQRLILSFDADIFSYSTKSCPFIKLFHYKNHHTVSSIGLITINLPKTKFTISLVSYLQRLDAIGDCTSGFGLVDQEDDMNWFCVRCSPGKFGLGCQPCTPGFYCQGYSQLQPTGPCPEGYYCLEGTSFGFIDNVDKIYDGILLPNLCPPGSYCPAGTETYLEDDLKHNNPKLCLEGYYCPAGSTKPTQRSCPNNSISQTGSKSLTDCYCKDGYYGDTLKTGFCTKCLENGICKQNVSKHNHENLMYVPAGFWPNTPENAQELISCYVSLTG
ncbi:hypothetical protein RF11_02443 [Thelohanellus kitauei]|uniref:Tyrosine-protein kinase ephrin type A/B receptor-like domain-containing protein n=1 Tax=Thelohanellus kitauei TaxID=669202 RepID=A0A0C2MPG4_THEKT|nr:hypothetical protein RF11_02443 [Thelohanellus kitauei]